MGCIVGGGVLWKVMAEGDWFGEALRMCLGGGGLKEKKTPELALGNISAWYRLLNGLIVNWKRS